MLLFHQIHPLLEQRWKWTAAQQPQGFGKFMFRGTKNKMVTPKQETLGFPFQFHSHWFIYTVAFHHYRNALYKRNSSKSKRYIQPNQSNFFLMKSYRFKLNNIQSTSTVNITQSSICVLFLMLYSFTKQ